MSKEKDLTKEQILAKAKELSEQYKTEVTPIAFPHNGKQIIGYLKNPDRGNKMEALNMMMNGKRTHAGELILRTSLLPESSPEILSFDPKDDMCFLTGCLNAAGLVDFYANDLKKNTSE